MKLILMSLLIFLLAVLGMAIGILTGRQPIKGGCGGSRPVSITMAIPSTASRNISKLIRISFMAFFYCIR